MKNLPIPMGKPTTTIEQADELVSVKIAITREHQGVQFRDYGQLLADVETFVDRVIGNCVVVEVVEES